MKFWLGHHACWLHALCYVLGEFAGDLMLGTPCAWGAGTGWDNDVHIVGGCCDVTENKRRLGRPRAGQVGGEEGEGIGNVELPRAPLGF
jgi:hypothetical protein